MLINDAVINDAVSARLGYFRSHAVNADSIREALEARPLVGWGIKKVSMGLYERAPRDAAV